MSYSFEFKASSVAEAAEKAEEQRKNPNVPPELVDLLRSAISGVALKAPGKTIHVKANGHHCDGQSYEVTNHNMVVQPVTEG